LLKRLDADLESNQMQAIPSQDFDRYCHSPEFKLLTAYFNSLFLFPTLVLQEWNILQDPRITIPPRTKN